MDIVKKVFHIYTNLRMYVNHITLVSGQNKNINPKQYLFSLKKNEI